MKKLASVLLLCVSFLAVPTLASDVQVIANSSVTAADLTAADVKEIFLGSKSSVGGSAVEPVLGGGAAHDAFLKAYVGKTDQGLRNHFKSLVFTGKGSMPKSFASDAEVVKYVASTKGAIGYISATSDAAGVKKIHVK
jgi:ABC-type phosphate transport system substrate-binding protein